MQRERIDCTVCECMQVAVKSFRQQLTYSFAYVMAIITVRIIGVGYAAFHCPAVHTDFLVSQGLEAIHPISLTVIKYI